MEREKMYVGIGQNIAIAVPGISSCAIDMYMKQPAMVLLKLLRAHPGAETGDSRPVAEREPRPRRREPPPPAFPKRHLFITIAITGIAFILGSFFYQKKSESTS
ncbi:Neurogenic locus notch-like protein 2 [Bienertia sinuspersici]